MCYLLNWLHNTCVCNAAAYLQSNRVSCPIFTSVCHLHVQLVVWSYFFQGKRLHFLFFIFLSSRHIYTRLLGSVTELFCQDCGAGLCILYRGSRTKLLSSRIIYLWWKIRIWASICNDNTSKMVSTPFGNISAPKTPQTGHIWSTTQHPYPRFYRRKPAP